MAEKGIKLITCTSASVFYTGFNMRDSVVGGYAPEKQKLRQAISIARDRQCNDIHGRLLPFRCGDRVHVPGCILQFDRASGLDWPGRLGGLGRGERRKSDQRGQEDQYNVSHLSPAFREAE